MSPLKGGPRCAMATAHESHNNKHTTVRTKCARQLNANKHASIGFSYHPGLPSFVMHEPQFLKGFLFACLVQGKYLINVTILCDLQIPPNSLNSLRPQTSRVLTPPHTKKHTLRQKGYQFGSGFLLIYLSLPVEGQACMSGTHSRLYTPLTPPTH